MKPHIEPTSVPGTQPKVAVVARGAARLAVLQEAVTAAGLMLVEERSADVVLLDGDTMISDRPVVALGASQRGHAGWLPIDASSEQIEAALRAVAAGLLVRPAAAPAHGGFGREFAELPERSPRLLLTPRESDVLAAISGGLSNKAIARQLGISLHTVKFHVESLFRKLGARTRAEAVAKGLERSIGETVEV